jgi:hypothetical protein
MNVRLPVLAAAFAFLTLSPSALAADDETELQRLRLVFADGQALEIAGRWADALARFDEVARVRKTPQVEFHQALCLERMGRLLQAERVFKSARANAVVAAPVVVIEADSHLVDLATRIPRVHIAISGEARNLVLKLDGVELAGPSTARVDPGPHVLVAMRDGRTISAVAFSVTERREKTVTLKVYPENGWRRARDGAPEARLAR